MKRNCLWPGLVALLVLVFVMTPRVDAQSAQRNKAAESGKPAKSTAAKKVSDTGGEKKVAPATSKTSAKPRKATEAAATASKTEAEPAKAPAVTRRRRLPRFFGQLALDEDQREAIYAIQEKFQAELDELQKQIDARTMDRDTEISGVLKPSQQKQLEELLVQAKTRSTRSRNSKLRVASTEASTSEGKNTEGDPVEENPEK